MRTRLALCVVLVLLARPSLAQPIAGTLTWEHARTLDVTSYRASVDGAPAVDLGLPTSNAASFPLAVGSHQVIVEACYGTECLPSQAFAVTVVPAGTPPPGPEITNVSPADGAKFSAAVASSSGIPVQATITASSALSKVELHWTLGQNLTVFACGTAGTPCVKNGSVYTFTIKPSAGAATRSWVVRAVDSAGKVATTPPRTVIVF